MTKPDKAKMVENHLCQMARSGQLQSKFSEEQLISLLERLSEQTQKKTIVNVCFVSFIFNPLGRSVPPVDKYSYKRLET